MKKACLKCKYIVNDDVKECPICKSTSFVENFRGRVYIFDPDRSLVAKKIGINIKGEFAIKTR